MPDEIIKIQITITADGTVWVLPTVEKRFLSIAEFDMYVNFLTELATIVRVVEPPAGTKKPKP